MSHQIDKLGERLRSGEIDEADLRLLDEYRRSFTDAYQEVVGTARDIFHLSPTGRPAKTTSSIAEKLARESVRLSQMQDVAGCRIVVPDVGDQDHTVNLFKDHFGNVAIFDRREITSHGYRAVHVVVRCQGKAVEVQIRTEMQHSWAELSEKMSDVIDPLIKYGQGPEAVLDFLKQTSDDVGNIEQSERNLLRLSSADDLGLEFHTAARNFAESKARYATFLRETIKAWEEF